MAVVSMLQLLEAGCHFGHTTRRWDPKMRPYIFTAKNGIYILDLKITVQKINEAYQALLEIVQNGGQVLFVGTKKQAQEAVKEAALKTGQFYVSQRWLGGTLTNFKTIRLRIKKLNELIKREADGEFEKLSKKEVLGLRHLRFKLEKNLEGIKELRKTPDALFIVDPSKELIAIREAKKIGIPVFGIVDTNCDPSMVDYVIPSNDDAVRAVKLIVDIMANAVIEAQGGQVEHVDDEEITDMNLENIDIKKEDIEVRRPRKSKKPYINKREEATPKFAKKEEVATPKVEKPVAKEEVVATPKVEKPVAKEEVATPKVEKPVAKEEVVTTPKVEKPEVVAEKAAVTVKETAAELEKLTVVKLREKAKSLGLSGYSKLKKAELIALILG